MREEEANGQASQHQEGPSGQNVFDNSTYDDEFFSLSFFLLFPFRTLSYFNPVRTAERTKANDDQPTE
uniref:Uncharacterized protein n=1 Tax=Acrobeloides nanus TaxID=290746 RepID=A0A914D4H5_9BILA